MSTSFTAKEVPVGDKTAVVRPAVLMNVIRLSALLDRIKADLGLSREDLSKLEVGPQAIGTLLSRLVQAAVGQIDLEDPKAPLKGNGRLVCQEIGLLVGLEAEDIAFAPLDDLYQVGIALWEVNASGPLGARLKATIARWEGVLEVAKDAVMVSFQKAFIEALPGGMSDGGPTGSSIPSSESSDGPTTTSSTSPSDASSNSSPPSDTTAGSSAPSSMSAEVTGEALPESEPTAA